MLFALTFGGCIAWIDQEPACGKDVYDWSDDLLAWVLTGDGSGEFDFDPDDDPRTSLSGAYDPSSGDFSWSTKYDSGFYLRKEDSEGFGTVYHNGNLDLLWTAVVEDVLGVQTETNYRVQRDSCDMTVATWDASQDIDSALVMTGSYEDDSVYSWSADVAGYTYQGSMRDNLIHTWLLEADDGSYWGFTSYKPTGETTQEWNGDCSDYYCEGTSTRQFDGTLEEQYTAYDGDDVFVEVSGELAYDGSGTETYTYADGTVCDFDYDDSGDCSYTCDDGSDGNCG